MKPIYLEINNFGPHEHSVIDFRKLDESPIFLIGGDTGAGKSTIFDAMTFALFNSTTGTRDAREMRSQFADPEDATKVVFYFEQSGKIYKIERTPEQFLAKKSGKGTTKKTPTANLAVVEDVDGVEVESIATKPVDVGHAIADILNLNADQFKKIILLPQNDFSEFLKSNTAEKEKILKKIFGTQLFTDFTAKLKDHFDVANSKSADFNNELKSQTESPIWTEEEQANLANTTNDQLTVVIQGYLDGRQTKLTAAKEQEKKIDAAWKKADKTYHDAEVIKTNFDKLAESEQEYQTKIVDQSENIKLKNNHLAELSWAQPLQETVRDLDKNRSEQKQISANVQDASANLADIKVKLESSKITFEQLNKQSPDFEAKNAQAQKLDIVITKARDVESIKAELHTLKPKLAEAQNIVQAQTAALEELKQTIATKTKSATVFEGLSDKKDTLVQEKDTLIDTMTPLENHRNTVAATAQQLQERLQKLTADAKNKESILEVARKDYQEKIKTRQSLMIAQLRQELTDGKPCAVCGSTEHPYAKKTVEADNDKLRSSMDAVDDSQKAFAAAESAVNDINQNLDELSAEFSQKQLDAVTALRELSAKYNEMLDQVSIELPGTFDFKEIKQQFQIKIAEIDDQLKAAQKLADEIKALEQRQNSAQAKQITASSEFEKLSTQYQTRSKDLEKKLQDLEDPDISSSDLLTQQTELKKAYNKFQTELKQTQETLHDNENIFSTTQTHLTDVNERLTQKEADLKKLSEQLKQALESADAKTNNFETLDKWINEINQNKLFELQNTITSYTKEKELLSANINKLKEALNDIEMPNTATLKTTADDLSNQKNAAITLSATTNSDFTKAQKVFETVKKIMQQQGDFAKELAAITSLYNVVNGKDGNDNKLKLETYVVQNYLQKILSYANATFLNHLSHNRYSFVISTKGADKQRDHGLDINVYDRETDAVRSSDTLSGGETFIAALSIALSLSEVVQSSANGVQIDALFVDEGFGSLDDETLDDAMDALEEIGKNRMVGVISHIDSMKQRIGQQLLVKKVGDGKSKIELVNK